MYIKHKLNIVNYFSACVIYPEGADIALDKEGDIDKKQVEVQKSCENRCNYLIIN